MVFFASSSEVDDLFRKLKDYRTAIGTVRKITSGTIFKLGFWTGVFLFCVANLLSYPMSGSIRISPKLGLLDDGHAFGFPFAFYFVWSGVPRESNFIRLEALLNLLIAVLVSLLIGVALRKLFQNKIPIPMGSNGSDL